MEQTNDEHIGVSQIGQIHVPTMYDPLATIAGIATPAGEGGIAVIRISGPDAIPIATKIFSGPVGTYATHTAHFGKFLSTRGEKIDEGLLLIMRAPRSYTGEDVVELHCHGGQLVTRLLLDTVLAAGALAAKPGEFTFKAFINKKLDLAQAEAVQALISAKNTTALRVAGQQLEGRLSMQIVEFQTRLTNLAAILEAWVDFPEEGLEFASHREVLAQLEILLGQIRDLERTFERGRIVQQGIALCLVGLPNAGKSSLMNALLGKDRAIVTEIPGTTRDVIEEDLYVGRLQFRVSDTAGLRETEEVVEQAGIRKTLQTMEKADFILLVFDAQRGLGVQEQKLLSTVSPSNTLIVWNKTDLSHAPIPPMLPFSSISVSAKQGWGIEELLQKIETFGFQGDDLSKDAMIVTNSRHKQSLHSASIAIEQLICGLKTDISPEFLAADMRAALGHLGSIIGCDITEDILSAIFAKFCVGK